jgi:hypothetical protein
MISALVSATSRHTRRTVSDASFAPDRVAYGDGVDELLLLHHKNRVLRLQAGRRPQWWDHPRQLWLTALLRRGGGVPARAVSADHLDLVVAGGPRPRRWPRTW